MSLIDEIKNLDPEVFRRIVKEAIVEAGREFSPTAIKAIYDKGKQNNPEGELARSTYERITGKKWSAETKPVTTSTTSTTPSTPKPSKKSAAIAEKISEKLQDIIDIANGDMTPANSTNVNLHDLSMKVVNMYNTELTSGDVSFIDAMSDADYDTVSRFFEFFSERVKKTRGVDEKLEASIDKILLIFKKYIKLA
jgi:hypothetical protein